MRRCGRSRDRFREREIVVADDGSRDGTARRSRGGRSACRAPAAAGQGPGADAGASGALDPGPLLLCDADLDGDLGPLVEAGADLAVARFAEREGGGFGIAKALARALIRLRSGFEAARAAVGPALPVAVPRDRACFPLAAGFGCETRMTIDAARAGLDGPRDRARRCATAPPAATCAGSSIAGASSSTPSSPAARRRSTTVDCGFPSSGGSPASGTDAAVAAVAAVGPRGRRLERARARVPQAPGRRRDDRRAQARRHPAHRAARDAPRLGSDPHRPRGERAQPAGHRAGTGAQGVSRGAPSSSTRPRAWPSCSFPTIFARWPCSGTRARTVWAPC